MRIQFQDLDKSEVKDLGIFLRKGLGGPGGRGLFTDEDILLWKYFDRQDDCRSRSIVARNDDGEIVAHLGATFARMKVPGEEGKLFKAMFPIDWLSFQLGAGLKILKIAAAESDVIYSMGGTVNAHNGLYASKCKRMGDANYSRKFLSRQRAVAQAFEGTDNPVRKSLRALRNLLIFRDLNRPSNEISLEQKLSFSEADCGDYGMLGFVHTLRSPERMNHLLRHPRGFITAWNVVRGGQNIGHAVLCAGNTHHSGKVLDLQIRDEHSELLPAIYNHLLHKLKKMGAMTIYQLATSDIYAAALRQNSFHGWGTKPMILRGNCFTQGLKYHFTALEADLGYE